VHCQQPRAAVYQVVDIRWCSPAAECAQVGPFGLVWDPPMSSRPKEAAMPLVPWLPESRIHDR